jgi:hypothetical protein
VCLTSPEVRPDRPARRAVRLRAGPRPRRTAPPAAPGRGRRPASPPRRPDRRPVPAAQAHRHRRRNLITELDAAAQLPAKAADAYRARIRERFTQLCTERETITAQLTELAHDTGQHPNDATLIDELPELPGRLDELPERIQAALFAAFDIQVLWNPPMRQATFFATITDTSPGIITDLLTRASDDDPATTSAAHPGTPATSTNPSTAEFSDLPRLPILRKVATNPRG